MTIKRTFKPNGFSLSGAIDGHNAESISTSLNSVPDEPGDLVLDLSGLEFREVSDIKAVVSAAKSVKGRRRVLLYGLPPLLQTVMTLVGWVESPSYVVCTTAASKA